MLKSRTRQKTLAILVTLVMVLTLVPLTGSGLGTTTLNIASSDIHITEAGSYLIQGAATPTDHSITVAKDLDVNITLENVHIDVSQHSNIAAFSIEEESLGQVTVNLIGDNTLISGSGRAGLEKNTAVNLVGLLTIQGPGSLMAQGGSGAAGIGGGRLKSTNSILINGGTITAFGRDDAGSTLNGGAGIGGGTTGNGYVITISGGTVTASGGAGAAGIGGGSLRVGANILITDGQVTATGGLNGAGIGGGNASDGIEIEIQSGQVSAVGSSRGAGIGGGGARDADNYFAGGNGNYITISGGTVNVSGGLSASGIGGGGKYSGRPDSDKGNGSNITISGGEITALAGVDYPAIGWGVNNRISPQADRQIRVWTGNGSAETLLGVFQGPDNHPYTAEDRYFESSEEDKLTVYNINTHGDDIVITEDGTYRIEGNGEPASHTITVKKDISAHITLSNVWIDVMGQYGKAAFAIEEDSAGDVTLALQGNSELHSGNQKAGLEKNGMGADVGTLTIEGSGHLNVFGHLDGAAGIGGSRLHGTRHIVINGGTITAIGGQAGIGGGAAGNGLDIVINTGTVTAQGGQYSAGIGGSTNNIGKVAIHGGIVEATGGFQGAGIGSGMGASEASEILITGGTITAQGGPDASGMGLGGNANAATITISPSQDRQILVYVGETAPGSLLKTYLASAPYQGTHPFFFAEEVERTMEKALLSIDPLPVINLPGGAAKTVEGLNLPSTVSLITDQGPVDGSILWQVDQANYDPDSREAQSFTVEGLAVLPEDVSNPDLLDLTVLIQISVEGRSSVGGSDGSFNPYVQTPAPPTPLAYLLEHGLEQASWEIQLSPDQTRALVSLGEEASQLFGTNNTLQLVIPDLEGVNQFGIALPAVQLGRKESRGQLTLVTPIGRLTLPQNLLADQAGLSQQVLTLLLYKASPSDLSRRPLVGLDVILDDEILLWHGPLQLSLPYTPSSEEEPDLESLVARLISLQGESHSFAQGFYDPSTQSMLIKASRPGLYGIDFNPISFLDVSPSAWYRQAAAFAAARGITAGIGEQQFAPEAPLTRGQFLVLLMNAYGLAPEASPSDNFIDGGQTWYTDHLAAAKKLGIAGGIGENRFEPEREILRQEMFAMLSNVLSYMEELPEAAPRLDLADFADANQVEDWAREALQNLIKGGVVGGYDGHLHPNKGATRAEAVQVIYNLLTSPKL